MLKLFIIFAALAVSQGFAQVSYTLYKKRLDVRLNGLSAVPQSYNSTDMTIFLIHGNTGNSDRRFSQLIRDAIFDYRNPNDYNVIDVNWNLLSSSSSTQVRNLVYEVAVSLANFIRWITDAQNSPQAYNAPYTESMHLVGFDLGAHVAGITGRLLQADSKLIGRITGLDPSGLQWSARFDHLRQTDARYVEVIHTDTSGLLARGIGDPIGDVNFYANGGSNQPGCLTHSCNHDRAFELFAASLINPNLFGRGCTSKTQMNLNLCRSGHLNLGGLALLKNGVSIYRIETSRGYPFYWN